jgi:hypothetical protein
MAFSLVDAHLRFQKGHQKLQYRKSPMPYIQTPLDLHDEPPGQTSISEPLWFQGEPMASSVLQIRYLKELTVLYTQKCATPHILNVPKRHKYADTV